MNKKTILIPSLLILGVMALGSLSNAVALYTQTADDASFRMSQEPSIFLKGSFNEWTASNSYLFTNNTLSMEAEANKTTEYIISKNLAKNDELKVWNTLDYWYTQGTDDCVYEDKWSRETVDDANYIVPMTASYEIKLKLYSTGDKKVSITAPNIETLYLQPNSNWTSDSARFAAYFFTGGDPIWRNMTDSNSDGIYEVDIPSGYSNVIFCRMNPATNDNNFNEGVKWNQTGDLSFSVTGYKNLYNIPGESWNVEGEGIGANWDSL